MNCVVCGKPLKSKRAKMYCSNACKMVARNNSKQGDDTVKSKTDTVQLSVSDAQFNEYRPGYYHFGDTVHSKNCILCGKEFSTRLKLLNACSPQHYEELVTRLSTNRRHEE